MPCHILNRHSPRQIQGIPLKSPGIGKSLIDKAKIHLTNSPQSAQSNPLNLKACLDVGEVKKYYPGTYGNCSESPGDGAPKHHIATLTNRTTNLVTLMLNGKDDGTPLRTEPEHNCSQQDRIHDTKDPWTYFPSSKKKSVSISLWGCTSIFFNSKVRISRMNHNTICKS